MQNNFVTAGEFAKLARTTKRTIIWYEAKGILQPRHLDAQGRRWYDPQQLVDFQAVALMTTLGFSLAEIAEYLSKGLSLQHLFAMKHAALQQKLADIQHSLAETKHYAANLASTKTLIKPFIKEIKPCEIFYITKRGPYAHINDFHIEFRQMFASFPSNTKSFTMFLDNKYMPQNARMRIGAVYKPGMKLQPASQVQQEPLPGYRALAYVHRGSGALLSLIWEEMERYRVQAELPRDPQAVFADIEYYDPAFNPTTDNDRLKCSLHTPIMVPLKQLQVKQLSELFSSSKFICSRTGVDNNRFFGLGPQQTKSCQEDGRSYWVIVSRELRPQTREP